MALDLPIFQLAGAKARHASASHNANAQNIANADTPGFKAHSIASFNAEIALTRDADSLFEMRENRNAVASPNGNSVSLDEEILGAASAKMEHETAVAIYRKSMELLRMSLGRR